MEKEIFQVYAHQNIHTGVPFYIGSGKLGRAYDKRSGKHNNDWENEVDLLGDVYEVRIIKEFDNIDEARNLEDKLLHFYGLRKHGGLLTNQRFFTKGGPQGYKFTPEQCEKQSEKATEAQNRPEVVDAKRIAQCNFSKITVCDGRWFIVNGSYEAQRILKEMGYNISHMTIQHYAKMNATLAVPKPFTGANSSPHKKGSIHIIIVPSTLEEYQRYQNDYGAHSDTVSSGE